MKWKDPIAVKGSAWNHRGKKLLFFVKSAALVFGACQSCYLNNTNITNTTSTIPGQKGS